MKSWSPGLQYRVGRNVPKQWSIALLISSTVYSVLLKRLFWLSGVRWSGTDGGNGP